MTTSVLVPVKPFADAKSRLAEILTDDRRAALCRDLLAHTLSVVRDCPSVAATIVISREAAARDMAAGYGAETAAEAPEDGLNQALATGAALATRRGAAAVLVLPADLPALGSNDVEALIAARGHALPGIAIAPDAAGDGTNALLLTLPAPIAFRFGPGSFAVHCAAARAAGITPAIVERPGLAFDLDTPADYARLPPEFGGAP